MGAAAVVNLPEVCPGRYIDRGFRRQTSGSLVDYNLQVISFSKNQLGPPHRIGLLAKT